MASYSVRNAGSVHAERKAASSSMHAGISDSGTNRPPNSPNRPDSPGSRMSWLIDSSPRPVLPIKGNVVAALIVVGFGRLGRGDEGAQLPRVLAAGSLLDAGDHVDAPRPDLLDGIGHVVRREPSSQHETRARRHLIGQRPIEDLAGT